MKTMIGFFGIATLIALCSCSMDFSSEISTASGVTHFRQGALYRAGQVPVVSVSGSDYDMGLQLGVLLKDDLTTAFLRVAEVKRGFVEYVDWFMKPFVDIGLVYADAASLERRLPPDILDLLKGMSDGAGLSYDLVLFAAGGMGTLDLACSSVVEKKGSRILHGRNLEWAPGWIGDLPVVVTCSPAGKKTFTLVSSLIFPFAVLSGMNDSGISASINIVACNRNRSSSCAPIFYELFDVLASAATLADVETRLSGYRTDIGWLVTVCSAADGDGAIFELATDTVIRIGLNSDGYVFGLNAFIDPYLNMRFTGHLDPRSHANTPRFDEWKNMLDAVTTLDVDSVIGQLAHRSVNGNASWNDGIDGINGESTIQSVVFDPQNRDIYFASASSFSAATRFIRFEAATGSATAYREADPVVSQTWMVKRMAMNENYLIDFYTGNFQNILRYIDLSDGVEPFEAFVLFDIWKASPTAVDAASLEAALDAVCAACPGYARIFLARAEYRLSKGDYSGCLADANAVLLCNPLKPLKEMQAYELMAKAQSASGDAQGAKATAVLWRAVFDSLSLYYAVTAEDAQRRDEMAKY